MKLRIRMRLGPAMERRLARFRKLVSGISAFLTPAAVMAFVLGLWRLGADLKWTGEFVIARGIFSHWQVWIALSGVLQTCAAILSRVGRAPSEGEGEATT